MSVTVEPEFLIRVFLKLRQRGVQLGVSDLLAALRLLDGDWPFKDLAELRQDAQRLWCYAWEHKHLLEEIWREEQPSQPATPPPPVEKQPATFPSDSGLRPQEAKATPSPQPTETPVAKPDETIVSTLPVRAPTLSGGRAELSIRWPLTTRAMAYGWQSLRRLRPDGPLTEIDFDATIGRIARDGYFTSPVYRRALRHHARLLLLIDRRGSMAPFHSLTNDLLTTARQAPEIEWVKARYFHDVVTETLYADPLLNDPLTLDEALAGCGPETSLLVISDGGAARGRLDSDRILATAEMIATLRRRSALLAWLNPMPQYRWLRNSAQVIQHLAPMFPLDQNGLTDAVKAVRGHHSSKPQAGALQASTR
jgi:uncharacterized protein